MSENNPYEAPKTSFDETPAGQIAPAIWNPNAAANWSLPFTPIFGAIVHMKNWQALGEPGKAAGSRNWAIASAVIILFSVLFGVFAGNDAFVRPLSLVLLISWYLASARSQARYVKERFGQDYRRKGWGKPLLYALLAVVGFFVVMFIVGIVMAILGYAENGQ